MYGSLRVGTFVGVQVIAELFSREGQETLHPSSKNLTKVSLVRHLALV
jgi:hypothetical protein